VSDPAAAGAVVFSFTCPVPVCRPARAAARHRGPAPRPGTPVPLRTEGPTPQPRSATGPGLTHHGQPAPRRAP